MGCRVCRARKVKCDGRPNGCRNCQRLQLDCDEGGGGGGGGSNSAPVPKMRTYRSCQSCRLSKTKCSGSRPRCGRCVAKAIECLYDGDSVPRWTTSLRRTVVDLKDAVTVEEEGEGEEAGPLSWLLSSELPTGPKLRRLVEQYFANVHPLRCFAFVHKPSFMHQLDKGGVGSEDESCSSSALLHIMCAHGARFLLVGHCLDGDVATPPPPTLVSSAGSQWARRAESLVLADLGTISIQRLMVAILLHDFHLRAGEYGQALMLSGLAVRMAHALKMDGEYDADVLCSSEPGPGAPSVASRESRRRLMWACYVLDAGSGADLLRESDIKIQLPSNERNFGLRIPAVTETLAVGHVLQLLAPAVVPRRPAANMGIMAYYIRLVALWKRIVRCGRQGPPPPPPPWQPDSPLAALEADLVQWRRDLPDFVEYCPETIYARLDSNQFGALLLIHCTYHHSHLELYKVAMADLFRLAEPAAEEQRQALQAAQAGCYHHARRISDMLAEAAEHGVRFLSDSQLPFYLYHSSRVMLYYVARLLDPRRPGAEAKMKDAVEAVERNGRVLRLMGILFPIARTLVSFCVWKG
ncbi:hypothetical protein L249_5296 [Ophiocordyceps polyrhachis-furcata BCC 54312]|uniref:Zn(2)-C6 fungal-type domain-containing protein n=1 Tax=Ophiocordyceps polyrhachis-furcata BCC 54312 TaxID=1330021 RepID=A0A367L967_9HYPO|nr:hypothetical protein L249_5296 [Ophiocordyceps polyrhachis-furcata BCC 54312]